MSPDTLSVISLCLLYETPCNAILLTICAIWSNIPELGSWKDSKSWNGICFSDYMQVSIYTGPISEKVMEIEIVQIAHKIPIWDCISGGLGNWHPV